MALPTIGNIVLPRSDDKENLVGLYTMYFRHQTNSLQSKNFRFHGSLKEAHNRAAAHCQVMGYRFHWVQPLISDLQIEEDFHLGRSPAAPAPSVELDLQREVKK